ncbi:hypothetical protein GGX14DRAFT_564163 [Mycena pura]|uniref:Uncharacterized protein n=1 Tax=Mycena pura TaxID=153505 RepID=A0AAD6VLL1_9AGAR|nr:hypothetical protein GGX14DRAFT_564163 [Mycena pura]
MRRVTLLTRRVLYKRHASNVLLPLTGDRHHLLLASSSLPPFYNLFAQPGASELAYIAELLSTPGQVTDPPPKSPHPVGALRVVVASFLAGLRMLGATTARLRDPAARGQRDRATGAAFLDRVAGSRLNFRTRFRETEFNTKSPHRTPHSSYSQAKSSITPGSQREQSSVARSVSLPLLPWTTTSVSLPLHIGARAHIVAQLHFCATGPWKNHFVETLPSLAKATWARARARRPRASGACSSHSACCLRSARVPVDPCASAPFMLGHLDLKPWIYCPAGPAAASIVDVIDWEMALTNAPHEPPRRVVGLGCEGAYAMQV